MKKNIFLLLTVMTALCCQTAHAQQYEAPNYVQIKKQISNSKSSQHFPKLMERFEACDTLLTNEEYRLLYYGFALREDFVPYQEKPQTFFDIRHKLVHTKADSLLLNKAISVTDEILEDNPFDISALSVRAIAYHQLGDSIQWELINSKIDGLIEAITSSGDGETEQSAYHVTDIEHEYEITARMGLVVVKDSVINNRTEYLRLEFPNAEDLHGIYFNFDACSSMYRKRYE